MEGLERRVNGVFSVPLNNRAQPKKAIRQHSTLVPLPKPQTVLLRTLDLQSYAERRIGDTATISVVTVNLPVDPSLVHSV
jgi:hypothetical protein